MKYILSIIFILLLPLPSHAYTLGEGWSWKDSLLEGVFVIESGIDLSQTLYQCDRPKQYYEAINPLLPRHPTRLQVYEAVGMGTILHTLISLTLKGKYRTWWQGTTIILEGWNDINNARVEVGWKF